MSQDRLKEIIQMAHELGWVYPPNETSYPLMHLSEVEKCMMAMFSDIEFGLMQKWVKEPESQALKGRDKLFDALLVFMEENPKIIAEGIDKIVAKMVAEGKLQSSTQEPTE